MTQELEKLSKKTDKSLNKTILALLRKGLGIEENVKYPVYHDLDSLSGTWSSEDLNEFNEAVSSFSKIDEELWK